MLKPSWVKVAGKVRKVFLEFIWDNQLRCGCSVPYVILDKRRVYLQVPSLA